MLIEKNKSGESNITKEFETILKDKKNNRQTTKSRNVESHDNNVNLYSLIIKLLNTEKTVLKTNYGSNEALDIFEKTDNNCYKHNEYKPRSSNKIDTKNVMLEYLRITEDKLIDMFFTPSIIKNFNNSKYKNYVHDKLKNKFENGDHLHYKTIHDSCKFQRIQKEKKKRPKNHLYYGKKLLLKSKITNAKNKRIMTIKIITPSKLLIQLPVL